MIQNTPLLVTKFTVAHLTTSSRMDQCTNFVPAKNKVHSPVCEAREVPTSQPTILSTWQPIMVSPLSRANKKYEACVCLQSSQDVTCWFFIYFVSYFYTKNVMEQAHISSEKFTTHCCGTNSYPFRLKLQNSLIYKIKYDHSALMLL